MMSDFTLLYANDSKMAKCAEDAKYTFGGEDRERIPFNLKLKEVSHNNNGYCYHEQFIGEPLSPCTPVTIMTVFIDDYDYINEPEAMLEILNGFEFEWSTDDRGYINESALAWYNEQTEDPQNELDEFLPFQNGVSTFLNDDWEYVEETDMTVYCYIKDPVTNRGLKIELDIGQVREED